MATFLESDLEFTFPEDWIVRRFDRTAAYRSVSGHGLKGVDFLCLVGEGDLWLIEVKNFRLRAGRHAIVRRNPEGLAAQVGKKFVDTKRLIRIVNRAIQRTWYTGVLRWWWTLAPPRWLPGRPVSTYWFWMEAERRLQSPRQVTCLLWLETPEWNAHYERATTDALGEWIEPGNILHVAERQWTKNHR
ncbi:hypothetical protein LEM8419_02994 [Neolewinella maritima]|uniref:NERD domain-containing protein n=1 Tax=Neolewinella maritima TaxID=1383882 RepID=A0ABN8F7U8_9BACT|nr:hypothetical protein [Neolewinella maritima]CAH1002077.1 hypothetical protein LEM8419_02994 [Neolewinella maritima]